jgi:hypothetical protein
VSTTPGWISASVHRSRDGTRSRKSSRKISFSQEVEVEKYLDTAAGVVSVLSDGHCFIAHAHMALTDAALTKVSPVNGKTMYRGSQVPHHMPPNGSTHRGRRDGANQPSSL